MESTKPVTLAPHPSYFWFVFWYFGVQNHYMVFWCILVSNLCSIWCVWCVLVYQNTHTCRIITWCFGFGAFLVLYLVCLMFWYILCAYFKYNNTFAVFGVFDMVLYCVLCVWCVGAFLCSICVVLFCVSVYLVFWCILGAYLCCIWCVWCILCVYFKHNSICAVFGVFGAFFVFISNIIVFVLYLACLVHFLCLFQI